MFRNSCYDRQTEINNTFNAENMDVDVDIDVMNNNQMAAQPMPMNMMGGANRPIIEPMQERVVNRTFVHEVPQV